MALQRLALAVLYLAFVVTTATRLHRRGHHPPSVGFFLLFLSLLLLFVGSLVVTIRSGTALGSFTEFYDRQKQPRTFWGIVAAQVFLCGVLIFCMVQSTRGW
jgi:hypothetical protein